MSTVETSDQIGALLILAATPVAPRSRRSQVHSTTQSSTPTA